MEHGGDINSMRVARHLFVKLAILLGFLFCADRITGLALEELLNRQQTGTLFDTQQLLAEATPNVVIFGDSRATHHYDSGLIKERTGLDFHNAGRAGMGIIYADALREVLLNRHLPDHILLEINPTNLYANQGDYERLSALLPYHRNHPELTPYLRLRSPWEPVKLLSRAYPFNSIGVNLLAGAFGEADGKNNAGYVELFGEMSPRAIAAASTEQHVGSTVHDPRELEHLRRFIDDSRDRGIKLTLIVSPAFSGAPERKALEDLASAIDDVELWDYLDETRLQGNSEYFYDRKHLNGKGARVFSELVAQRLLSSTN